MSQGWMEQVQQPRPLQPQMQPFEDVWAPLVTNQESPFENTFDSWL
jgi:hypothetical protein